MMSSLYGADIIPTLSGPAQSIKSVRHQVSDSALLSLSDVAAVALTASSALNTGQVELLDFKKSESDLSTDEREPPEEPKQIAEEKKGILYARVSGHEQAKRGSIHSQVDQLKRVAEKNSIELVREICDEAKTGKTFDRDGIRTLLKLAQRDDVSYVLMRDVDRLGRSAAETLFFIYILQTEFDITFLSSTGERDVETIHGLMDTTLRALMADVNNEIRIASAHNSKARLFLQERKWNAWYPQFDPVGYEVADDDWLTIDPEELEAAKLMFTSFLESETYAEVSRQVSEVVGIPVPATTIKNCLKNPVYIGRPSLPEDAVGGYAGTLEVQDDELSLVDEDTFYQVQQIIEEKDDLHSSSSDTVDLIEILDEFDLLSVVLTTPVARLLCPECDGRLRKNGTRPLVGSKVVHNYECVECGKNRRWPTRDEYERLDFVEKLLKMDKFARRIAGRAFDRN
ncbi:recombinase family protein [Haloferax sp. Atlit-12N]|uniref:recombinase family protein n=1 Tax=Haloferax sp. Atlit-12N TaxID=2077203 RepID=UPI00131440AE|nr:recombinase family protein [Haloferax sp. Atlit-12N]